jgi:hypothetical protein
MRSCEYSSQRALALVISWSLEPAPLFNLSNSTKKPKSPYVPSVCGHSNPYYLMFKPFPATAPRTMHAAIILTHYSLLTTHYSLFIVLL